MTKQQAEFLVALADHDMNISVTAEAMFYHRNTLVYQFKKIRKETGLNPGRFYDLCELLPLARAVLDESDT